MASSCHLSLSLRLSLYVPITRGSQILLHTTQSFATLAELLSVKIQIGRHLYEAGKKKLVVKCFSVVNFSPGPFSFPLFMLQNPAQISSPSATILNLSLFSVAFVPSTFFCSGLMIIWCRCLFPWQPGCELLGGRLDCTQISFVSPWYPLATQ